MPNLQEYQYEKQRGSMLPSVITVGILVALAIILFNIYTDKNNNDIIIETTGGACHHDYIERKAFVVKAGISGDISHFESRADAQRHADKLFLRNDIVNFKEKSYLVCTKCFNSKELEYIKE